MTNNDILKKLRVALKLRDEDIVDILTLAEFKVSKSEVNALFRTEDHPNYKECGDQLLRNFLNGLVIYMRGPEVEMRKPAMETKIAKREKPKLTVKKAIIDCQNKPKIGTNPIRINKICHKRKKDPLS